MDPIPPRLSRKVGKKGVRNQGKETGVGSARTGRAPQILNGIPTDAGWEAEVQPQPQSAAMRPIHRVRPPGSPSCSRPTFCTLFFSRLPLACAKPPDLLTQPQPRPGGGASRHFSPWTVTTRVRVRGLMSHSRWKICCQVPSTSSPASTGTVRSGPRTEACTWECPLPSCQACS